MRCISRSIGTSGVFSKRFTLRRLKQRAGSRATPLSSPSYNITVMGEYVSAKFAVKKSVFGGVEVAREDETKVARGLLVPLCQRHHRGQHERARSKSAADALAMVPRSFLNVVSPAAPSSERNRHRRTR